MNPQPDFALFTASDIATFRRRQARLESGGGSAPTRCRDRQDWQTACETGDWREFLPGKSSGRKPLVVLSIEAATALRREYIRTNLRRGHGSMTAAARLVARNAEADLTQAERDAVFYVGGKKARGLRASKHSLPVAVRRACRGQTGDIAVGDYRDPDTRRLGGLYAEGMLRMVREPDGSIRRLHPGERWSVDDASVNFPVCVPWPWGGDKCSEAFGVRIGRFQLLAALDDATDFCPGWNYTIRARDSYRAEDVVSMLDGVCRHAYKPERLMVEGGAWQAARTIAWREAAGIDWEDARGRPHSKLIENYFNRLWTILSTRSDGQIGRYRGEMDRETDFWMKAQEGTLDPRRAFPALETALAAVAWSVDYLQAERVESKLYGKWVPAEMHAAGLAALPRPQLAPGLAYLAMRERHMRVVRRMGMVGATALSPLGYTRPYVFGGEQLMAWDGAHVWLHFDPFSAPCTATATLAQAWRDTPAGTLLARDVRCLNAAPEVMRDEAAGTYRIGWSDPVAAALAEKRLANAAVRRELRVTGLGGGRLVAESELSAPEGVMHQAGILPASGPQTEPDEQDIDFAALEKAAGMVA